MDTEQIVGLLMIFNGDTNPAILSNDEIKELHTDGYISPTDENDFILTEKGKRLAILIQESVKYFEVHQEIKATTREFLDNAKTNYNKVLESLKFN